MLLGALICMGLACGGYTEVSSLTYFPTNATQHTEYTLQVEAHGQRCQAYSAFGEKRVFVTVFHKGSCILQKKYAIEATRLHWEVSWDEFSSPQVRFLDADNSNKTIQVVSLKVEPVARR
jgi:hypothetical protein